MIRHKKQGMAAAILVAAAAFTLMPTAWAHGGHHGAGATDAITPAYIIPLFPQKEVGLKKGFPPGMTHASFRAGHGSVALTKLANGKVKLDFHFSGLIPYGLYTLWNVKQLKPFHDEPMAEFGAGKHSVVAGSHGFAHKTVIRDSWPGQAFLLDYHSDGKLSQSKGVYPGALYGEFPPEPKR